MEALKNFQIEIIALSNGKHEFNFQIGIPFFKAIEQNIIEKGTLKAEVILNKSELLIKVDFKISGTVELVCDRTLKPFDYLLNSSNTIYYKYSDHYEELSDEVTLIKSDTSHLDVASPIFEFIVLSLPSKKIHPDFITDADQNSEDDILVYTTVNTANEPTDNNIDILDPRWEALKKLKDSL